MTRVFLSYIHDSERHKQQVLEFAIFLRSCGIDVAFDQWAGPARQDWYAWANREMLAADYILVIASAGYLEIGDGNGSANKNRGGQSEAATLRDLLQEDREKWLPKIVPVLLPGHHVTEIPRFLQPQAATRYPVESFTVEGAEDLLRMLTGQPGHVLPPLGSPPVLPPRSPAPVAGEPVWRELPAPAPALWRRDLVTDYYRPQGSMVELHLVPVGSPSRLPVRRLDTLRPELAALGRTKALFTPEQSLQANSTDRAVWAYSTDWRLGEAGIAVTRAGQRSCWFALPSVSPVRVLDEEDLVRTLVERLALLAEIELPAPEEIALAVGMDPLGILTFAKLSDAASSSSHSIHMGPEVVRVEPEEAVRFDDLQRFPEIIADELTARLISRLKRR
ncbi:hypothetical protein FHX82_003497 [Amycolatopsis bartoniae]|uniref:SEFIR domain-containing protein n=1 Tax=Amycolatopsis bartoniae TaxID=941986 RepID=UPI001605A48F|nr:SEFIR domain-containing protein [Amycolatopsis bartoniae]MBB2936433.1 hypothetical protein [Amycolatopsis bartoniae]